jgi:hypothetical protein
MHAGRHRILPFVLLAVGALGAAAPPGWAAHYDGRLAITVKDEKTGDPLAARMELHDAKGRPVRIRPAGAVALGDSIYFSGEVTLELGRGDYTFLIEAGPEFRTRPGRFTIDRRAEDMKEVTLRRIVDMQGEGWWAGDLDIEAPLADLPLMMRARGVDVAPAAAAVNQHGHCRNVKQKPAGDGAAADAGELLVGPWAALDRRKGGGLVLVGTDDAQPLPDVCRWKDDEPMLQAVDAGRDAGACVVAMTPLAWELPVWVASGKLDAVALIDRFTVPGAAADAGERPFDKSRYAGKAGVGRASEAAYHHLLNCGLRLPPAAGSGVVAGSGGREGVPPLGINRVYVQCGESCTRESWVAGLRAGQVMVTNGPLLRTRVEGQPPGHVFELAEGERHEFQIALDLAFYEQTNVEYLEIVKDGKAVHEIRLDELASKGGKLPPVEFDSSGWFLVRAVTENTDLYQFASTGPYYVEANYQPRIGRASVQFFLDWLDDAAKHFAGNAAMVAEIDAAKPFWEKLAKHANAE